MDKDSVAASVYYYTYFFFTSSLFVTFGDELASSRLRWTDVAAKQLYEETFIMIIESAARDGDYHFDPLCA